MKYFVSINLDLRGLYLLSLGTYDDSHKISVEEFIVNQVLKFYRIDNTYKPVLNMDFKYGYCALPADAIGPMVYKPMKFTPNEVIYNLIARGKKLPDEIERIIRKY
jgi:hypothetical protein